MLLDLLSQIEPDDSWRPQLPDPHARPYPIAAYTLATYVANLDIAITGAGPSGSLRPGTQRQYMASVAPLFTGPAPVTVTIEWIPDLPPLLFPLRRSSGWSAFIDRQSDVSDIGWLPELPAPRPGDRRSDGWYAFVPDAASSTVPWLPTYPLPISAVSRRDGWNAFLELESPIGMEWLAQTARRLPLIQTPQGWFAFLPVIETTPDRSWAPVFPDRLSQLRLPTGALQSFALEPFPRPPADLLSAWGIYPDRLNRVTLPPALMPAFFYGTWVPIPNPPTTLILEDRILIGQNQSIETPFYPSIGGSTTWS